MHCPKLSHTLYSKHKNRSHTNKFSERLSFGIKQFPLIFSDSQGENLCIYKYTLWEVQFFLRVKQLGLFNICDLTNNSSKVKLNPQFFNILQIQKSGMKPHDGILPYVFFL